jgi:FixJ family two-component response regulator
MTLSPPQNFNVFIVDDDADLRNSLLELVEVLGYRALAFASGSQFRHYYRAGMPGCLLLDVHMPRQSGLELYEQLIQEGSRLPVIFITAHADVTTAVAAMKTGAIEFLEKPFNHTTLADRLSKALALDNQWRKRDAKLAEAESKIASLSARERETLQMIVEGCPNKVMAARFDLTERAIEMRRARIMSKLNVRTVAELLDVAITYRVMDELRELRKTRELHL